MLRKYILLLLLGSMAMVALAACGSTSAAPTALAQTGENQVHMSATKFTPGSITIKQGESITLVNDTFTPHFIANGTWQNGSPKPGSEAGAPEVKNLHIDGNKSASIGPFTTAGTFHLYCTIHPNMSLTVIVS